MHSNSILNSNLLDIIFENRNKDYGAYVLRKNYNLRLFKSLAIMLGLVSLFVIWLMVTKKNLPTRSTIPFPIPPNVVSLTPVIQSEKHVSVHAAMSKFINPPPIIVKDIPKESTTPITVQTLIDNTGDNIAPPSDEPAIAGTSATSARVIEPIKSPGLDRSVPINNPDILPQFPGGIKELIKFLKRNLNTPSQLEDGEEVGVKIKFVVNYSGDLMGFDVIETGSQSFDDEVLRVLKKMPKWIPGRTNGENVSTYFILPVKFRVSE